MFSEIGLKRKHDADYWKWFLEDYLKPVLEKLNIEAHASVARTGSITKEIMQSLAYKDLVFAVTTDENPNVFYELGVRHASRHGTIILMEQGLTLPFDTKDYGTVFYKDTDASRLENDIHTQLQTVPRKDSPPAEFLKIAPSLAINVSIGTLQTVVREIQCVETSGNDPLEWIRQYDKLLDQTVQISIVAQNRMLYHRDPDVQNKTPILECWQGVIKPGESFLPEMQSRRTGIQLGQIRDRDNRMTAIAFETLAHPDWLIVTEAHYFQVGERPY